MVEKYAELVKLGAEELSVSMDTKFLYMAWKHDERLLKNVKFQLGGVFIAPEGNFFNVGRNAEALVHKREANAHLLAHPNEACPANALDQRRWGHSGPQCLFPTAHPQTLAPCFRDLLENRWDHSRVFATRTIHDLGRQTLRPLV